MCSLFLSETPQVFVELHDMRLPDVITNGGSRQARRFSVLLSVRTDTARPPLAPLPGNDRMTHESNRGGDSYKEEGNLMVCIVLYSKAAGLDRWNYLHALYWSSATLGDARWRCGVSS